jgi:hypothetical protein
MHRSCRAFLLLACCCVLPSPAPAAEPAGPTTRPAEPAAAPAPSRPGPTYMNLRYDDDFSYLEGPEGSYTPDFFDPIKNIRLGEDWRLRLGGEVRERMEAETNRTFGARNPAQDTYLLHRIVLHADLSYHKLMRLYVEGIDAPVFDRDLPQLPGMQNRFDINQAFVDARILGEQTPLTLRFGRQEILYGKERLLGKLDWMNTTRRFDGAKLFYKGEKLDVDAFYFKPVVFGPKPFRPALRPKIDEGLDRKADHYREEMHLYGIYSTWKGIRDHVVDLYVIGLNDKGIFTNANGRFGDLSIYTIGGRFGGSSAGFDYDLETAGQWGKWTGDEVHAWMFGGDAGYTFKEVWATPRLGTGFDYASGDDTPRDNSHDTFHQLFPTGHAFLGYLDIAARQNILAPNVNLTLKPLKNLTAKVFYFHFWLDSNLDALYNAGGAPTRRDTSGHSGTEVGDEVDVTLTYQLDVHSSILFGYSHVWPGNFIESSGRSRDADLIYLQYAFKF